VVYHFASSIDIQPLPETTAALPKLRWMQIEILQNEQDRLAMYLRGCDLAYANAIRRAIHAEVPTLMIDSVKFRVNDTVANEEFLAHRLGLIPLVRDDIESFKYWYQCDHSEVRDEIGGCNSCGAKGVLRVYNHLEENLLVTDRDIQLERDIKTLTQARPELPPIPIIKLAPGQSLDCTCYVRKGKGKIHAKWSPASTVIMRPLAQVKLSTELRKAMQGGQQALAEAYLRDICPRDVFEMQGGTVRLIREENCIFCDECFRKELRLPDGPIAHPVIVTPRKDVYYMEIESVGAIPAEKIFQEALAEVKASLEGIQTMPGFPLDEVVEPGEGLEEDLQNEGDTENLDDFI